MKFLLLSCLAASCLGWASAQLPVMLGNDWAGYYAAHNASRYEFLMLPDAAITLVAKRRSRDPVAIDKQIRIECGLEEHGEDGATIFKRIRRESLGSAQEPTDRIRSLEIRGATAGGAALALLIDQQGDVMSLSGRVEDAGKLQPDALGFVVRVIIPNIYSRAEIEDRREQREFEHLTRRDQLEIERTDSSKLRLDGGDSGRFDAAVLTGAGVRKLGLRLSYYEGRRFCFEAGGASTITIVPTKVPGPWNQGMILEWRPAAKDAGALRCWVE